MNTPNKPPRKKKFENLYDKLLQGKLDHLTQEYRQHIEPVPSKYAYVFHDEESNDFKETKAVDNQILGECVTQISGSQSALAPRKMCVCSNTGAILRLRPI